MPDPFTITIELVEFLETNESASVKEVVNQYSYNSGDLIEGSIESARFELAGAEPLF